MPLRNVSAISLGENLDKPDRDRAKAYLDLLSSYKNLERSLTAKEIALITKAKREVRGLTAASKAVANIEAKRGELVRLSPALVIGTDEAPFSVIAEYFKWSLGIRRDGKKAFELEHRPERSLGFLFDLTKVWVIAPKRMAFQKLTRVCIHLGVVQRILIDSQNSAPSHVRAWTKGQSASLLNLDIC